MILGGCAPKAGDYFTPFRGEFAAEVVGSCHGVDFEARVCATAPDTAGAREMTVTFYAPAGLCGTTLKRDATGALTLGVDGLFLSLGDTAAAGYGAIFALFPTSGEVREVGREGENTRLTGAGFSLLLSPDGTPLESEGGDAHVRVLSWE